MTADIGLEWVVAGRGIVLGRVAQTGRWTLAARGLEYLPADLRPARRAVAPDVQAMLGRLTEDAQSLIRCRPVIVTIAGRLDGELLLGGDRKSTRLNSSH